MTASMLVAASAEADWASSPCLVTPRLMSATSGSALTRPTPLTLMERTVSLVVRLGLGGADGWTGEGSGQEPDGEAAGEPAESGASRGDGSGHGRGSSLCPLRAVSPIATGRCVIVAATGLASRSTSARAFRFPRSRWPSGRASTPAPAQPRRARLRPALRDGGAASELLELRGDPPLQEVEPAAQAVAGRSKDGLQPADRGGHDPAGRSEAHQEEQRGHAQPQGTKRLCEAGRELVLQLARRRDAQGPAHVGPGRPSTE